MGGEEELQCPPHVATLSFSKLNHSICDVSTFVRVRPKVLVSEHPDVHHHKIGFYDRTHELLCRVRRIDFTFKSFL